MHGELAQLIRADNDSVTVNVFFHGTRPAFNQICGLNYSEPRRYRADKIAQTDLAECMSPDHTPPPFARSTQSHKSPLLFRDTIMKLISSSNLGYKELTAKEQEPAA
jgi:hypothetical protein